MLTRIKRFFEEHLSATEAPEGDDEHALRLATAALLLEMVRMDHEVQAQERAAVEAAVRGHFGLGADEAAELLALAEEERAASADYYQFTSLINQHWPEPRKIALIEMLWRVAYADDELHKYEEHLVRTVADLIYVPHSAFIAAKHRAEPDQGGA